MSASFSCVTSWGDRMTCLFIGGSTFRWNWTPHRSTRPPTRLSHCGSSFVGRLDRSSWRQPINPRLCRVKRGSTPGSRAECPDGFRTAIPSEAVSTRGARPVELTALRRPGGARPYLLGVSVFSGVELSLRAVTTVDRYFVIDGENARQPRALPSNLTPHSVQTRTNSTARGSSGIVALLLLLAPAADLLSRCSTSPRG